MTRSVVISFVAILLGGCSGGGSGGAAGKDCSVNLGVADQQGNQTCGVDCVTYEMTCFRDAGGPPQCKCVSGPHNGAEFQLVDCDGLLGAAAQHCE